MTRSNAMAAMLVAALLPWGSMSAQSATAGSTTPAKKTTKHTTKAKTKKEESATEAQVKTLREEMQAQIDGLKTQLATKDQQTAAAQQSATDAATQAAAAQAAAAQAQADAAASVSKTTVLQGSVDDIKSSTTGLQETVIANQQRVQEEIESPSTLHYKGITITPVAFFAFEGVFRNRSVNSDINTPFNNIPFPEANEGHISELNFTGRQSRLGGLFEGNAGAYKLSGYFEADFLGTGTSSNNNQSNSYVLRQRQIWGQAATAKGFTVTGGQMWSMVTEDGKSTDNRTEKLPNTIDSQYMVGFSWARQPAIRFQQRFGDVKTHAFTVAMSLEQAQITNFTASGTIPTEFFFAGVGQNGGLYNAAGNIGSGNTAGTGAITTYANNTAPDVIVKTAYDLPKAHFELGGVARFMRDFYFPIATYTGTAAAPTYTYTPGEHEVSHVASVGGIFGSARVSVDKYVDVAVQAMVGQGTGRYGSSQLADATLRPDETLEPLHNYHGLFSLETHPMPKLDVYAYYGGEYAQRTVYTTPQGALIGYGTRALNDTGCYALPAEGGNGSGTFGSLAAANCASPTRYIQEGMMGFTYRVASSPKYGRLQYQTTYSYFQRNLWSGVGNATTPSGPRALDNMLDVSMRYYIP